MIQFFEGLHTVISESRFLQLAFYSKLDFGALSMSEKILPKVEKTTRRYVDRSRETAWIAAHEREYAGEWVVLDGERLIGHGDDPKPIVELARSQGIERPLVMHMRKEFGPFMGGWL